MDADKWKILAIDDNRDNLTALRAVVSDRLPGIRILTALDGLTGLKIALAEDPDVILLDIVMPGMDGYAVCRELKKDERLQTIPVLFLSALRTGRDDRIRALEAGAEGFLSKPFDDAELVAQIRAMTKIKAANRAGRMEKRHLTELVAERTRELEQELAERSKAEESLRRQTATLASVNRILEGSLNVDTHAEAARICLSEAQRLTGSEFGWIGEMNPSGRLDTIVLTESSWQSCRIAGAQPSTTRNMKVRGLLSRVLHQGETLITGQPSKHPGGAGFPAGHPPISALLGVPLQQDGRVIGMIALANKPGGYAAHDAKAIEALSVALVEALQRKRAEEALRDREAQLRAMFEVASVGIMQVDPASRRIVWSNEKFREIVGYGAAELQNMDFRDLTHPEDRDLDWKLFSRAVRGDTRDYRNEKRYVRKGGSVVWIRISAAFTRDASGRAVHGIAICEDITDYRRGEGERAALQAQLTQAQKMESIGRLAGGVAHDFNNLLTIIKGYAQLALARLDAQDPLRTRLEEIDKAGERAAGLTRQLLIFSRKQILEPRRLDLNKVVDGMRSMLARLVGEDVEMHVHLDAVEAIVRADPHQLEQVVMNLVVNSRDAMPRGGRLVIETTAVNIEGGAAQSPPGVPSGRYLMLAVSDSGTGMDEQTRQRVFEPFFTTKEAGKGTGLGLSVVHGIVSQSGGYLDVSSAPGCGATFRVYLPAAEGKGEETSAPKPELARGGKETVLVVEDQTEVRNYVTIALKSYGYRVVEARNAEEAFSIWERERESIDLVLSDVIMPKGSGPELAARLARLQPGVKVLLMSGYTHDALTPYGTLEASAGFIQKPFSPEQLAGKVSDLLRSRNRPIRILVADDDDGVREYLRTILEQDGYEVIEAADGLQAVQQACAHKVDLVITDLVMPECEGIETIRTLRKDLAGAAIIAISGAFGGQFLKTAQMLGADAALPKPVRGEVLLAKVSELLQQRR